MLGSAGIAPLRRTTLRRFWAGQTASRVGDMFYAVALPWYVLAHHGSTVLLGSVMAAYGVPRTLGMIFGGTLADRFRPWTVMIGTDTVRAAAIGSLAIVAATSTAQTATLLPISVVFGAMSGLFVPCASSILPALLPQRELAVGNALIAGSSYAAMLVGPALGGAAVALLGPPVAFAADSASFGASALTLLAVSRSAHACATSVRASETAAVRVPETPTVRAPETATVRAPEAAARAPETATADVRPAAEPHDDQTLSGLLHHSPFLQIVLTVAVAGSLAEGAVMDVGIPALAHGPLQTGPQGYGVMIAALGAGGILGATLAARFTAWRRPMVYLTGAFSGAAACLALTPYAGGTLAASGALLAFAALIGYANTVMTTVVQMWAPAALMGRLMGAIDLAGGGLYPLSVMLGGIVVHAAGPALLFPAGATLLALPMLGGLLHPDWRNFPAAGQVLPPTAPGARGRASIGS